MLQQRTIGMIGGVSAESTVLYYQLINQSMREKLGGLNSAKILLYSCNYADIVDLEEKGKWEEVTEELVRIAKLLEEGGADFIMLCCNTLHKVAPAIEKALSIPFLHIADTAGRALVLQGAKKIGLLGTRVTMEEEFYVDRLKNLFGLEVIVPFEKERKKLDSIIYNELCQGKVCLESKETLLRIIRSFTDEGVEAILLGCTELSMLVGQKEANVPLYDTMHLHSIEAINWRRRDEGS